MVVVFCIKVAVAVIAGENVAVGVEDIPVVSKVALVAVIVEADCAETSSDDELPNVT